MGLIDRFTGKDGKRLLIDALCTQAIVSGNREVAEKITAVGSLEEFPSGSKIIEQGGFDNDIFFIIGGVAAVIINGRELNERGPGQHVGEMALIDSSATRSATILAKENMLVARVSETAFSKIADEHPQLWRGIAVQLAERLRQRSKFIKHPNPQPHVFVGSSRESLPIATEIKERLESTPISVFLWTDDIFTASQTSIESLESELLRADFAILVLAPDDKVFSRGKDTEAPRDNVIFELGLFMGALTRSRTFFVRPTGMEIKIPSDLFGVTPLFYDVTADSMAKVCESMRKLILKCGPK